MGLYVVAFLWHTEIAGKQTVKKNTSFHYFDSGQAGRSLPFVTEYALRPSVMKQNAKHFQYLNLTTPNQYFLLKCCKLLSV